MNAGGLGAALHPEHPEGELSRRQRLAITLAASLATALGFAGALYLGAWAFDVRRFSTHEGRLARLLAQAPSQDQIERAFHDEGTLLLGSADGRIELAALARRYGGSRTAELLAAGGVFPRTQAYRAGDMIYFIHFDQAGVMRAFALVSR